MSKRDIVVRALTMRTSNQNAVEIDENYTAEFQADRFFIVDPTDTTKRLQFDASSVPTGTDVAVNRRRVIATGGAFATPIVLTAADSGNVYLLDTAAGLDFTLPAITAANVGMTFEFRVTAEVTSNSYRITAGDEADLFTGHVLIVDKDVAEDAATALFAIYRPDGSDDDALTISGSADTSGALVGGVLTFEAVSATSWFVHGTLVGDGDFVTVFS